MKLGVVGLPNVGKSTLFNAITNAGAQAANYPFCTIEPNVGVVPVPDKRLDVLEKMYHPEKYTPTSIEFVDIAGLVKGASRGEGLGNKFLSHIREVDAIVHVVRCFEGDVVHVDGSVDPVRDLETINLELIFADLETLQKRLDRAEKMKKSGEAQYKSEAALLESVKARLEQGIPVRAMELSEEEHGLVDGLFLLTQKPVIYVANIAEDDIGKAPEMLPLVEKLMAAVASEKALTLTISAKVEEELAQLDPEEKTMFLGELGIGESGLDRLVAACYDLLGLISYLTAGPKEVRAWTIERGTRAPQAAGKIHTDFEKGFIRAEIVSFDQLVEAGSMAAAKEHGWVRLEGKDYVMQDGDVVLFRFNV
ncbi:redox-regulated ATPase YchF [Gehongia tenuis]|uniref:Ribosome-binding ATPase YchF n=1 Tax=Gehongia tenuis TaxID=2763655 RepID=A0A926D7Y9_9FIRM|nr:redox-regulated ATPase YchF [Gehongia tenuis]MBC8532050.1 redox-regulated ATPase YchF [Gehongia tenuis]